MLLKPMHPNTGVRRRVGFNDTSPNVHFVSCGCQFPGKQATVISDASDLRRIFPREDRPGHMRHFEFSRVSNDPPLLHLPA
jgi:hypothetical protein